MSNGFLCLLGYVLFCKRTADLVHCAAEANGCRRLVLVEVTAGAGTQIVRTIGPRTSFVNARLITDEGGTWRVVGGIVIHVLGKGALVFLSVSPVVSDGRHVVTVSIVGVERSTVVMTFSSLFLWDRLSSDTSEGVLLGDETIFVDDLLGEHISTEGAIVSDIFEGQRTINVTNPFRNVASHIIQTVVVWPI